ncbi:MAG TPA: VWA domain-containing protein [Flavobacteriales bacterium]|nr:VWA domain-containing protein [Flavobacteriales bacterium]HMR27799.1 VWA domain-containing protein [Flavobacteriales bacterium]
MIGHRFAKYIPPADDRSPFEKLLPLFLELLTHTSGDVEEALDWMDQLDKEHGFYSVEYGRKEFEDDLRKHGMIGRPTKGGKAPLTGRAEKLIRERALDQVFGRLKKVDRGNHALRRTGQGDEPTSDRRGYRFGDRIEQVAMSDSIRNAQQRGLDELRMSEDDLEVIETEHQSACATVLMIDISHSMILYGEDRITPAKKVAMALAELIKRRYPKDTLDIVVFGNDAWQVSLKDLPYLQVGPFHTNTVAGLELAMDILRRRKVRNRRIVMITDGKPSCIKRDGEYYMNSFGLDEFIVARTLDAAVRARKAGIPITTFMIARDNYLQRFIERFTEANQGRAFYTGLQGLADMVFRDHTTNRKTS